jgi:methylphosphotriester-DNA--protein-cysteine methyltransferase
MSLNARINQSLASLEDRFDSVFGVEERMFARKKRKMKVGRYLKDGERRCEYQLALGYESERRVNEKIARANTEIGGGR